MMTNSLRVACGILAWTCAACSGRSVVGISQVVSDAGPTLPAPSDAGLPPVDADAGANPRDAASPDAAVVVAPALPACLGAAIPMDLTNGPHVRISIGTGPQAVAASFLVDYGTTRSSLDFSAYAPLRDVATQCDPSKLGQICSFANLDFFGAWGSVRLMSSWSTTLGTDFLSTGIYTLDYAGKRMLHAESKATACTDDELLKAGFAPLSTAGFFANDFARLKPLQDVDRDAVGTITVANVPTVPVRIAGTDALTQLDTGFEDSVVPHSINVNVAYLEAVQAASPGALLRDAAHDLTLSTCAGVSEPVEAYRLADGRAFEMIDVQGGRARTWGDATVFVKRTPAAARKCAGIGTWSVPAAQIGASFFSDMRVVVFDAIASRVWIGLAPR